MTEKQKIEKRRAVISNKSSGKKRFLGISRLWRETSGELRKVSWPTTQEAWHLTRIVIIVMVAMSFLLGFFDFIFAELIGIIFA